MIVQLQRVHYVAKVPLKVKKRPLYSYKSAKISNGNRTEWSPIRSVIIRVITKLTAQRESDLFITSMITDRIGRHEVLLPINHKNYTFREKKNSQVV